MVSQRGRSPGRGRLAVLGAAALIGAGTAGSAWSPAPQESPAGPRATTVTSDEHAMLDERPRLVAVDDTLVRSVARQVLAEREQPEHLTDLDLITRDVLALEPSDPAAAAELTRHVLAGHGPPGPAGPGEPAPPQCPPTASACIDVDGKRAWMVDDGIVTYGPVPVTTGKPGYETVRGSHRVLRQVRDDHSRIFDAPMPFSTYFTTSGIAFHEGGLDEPSHGCIHLGHHAAVHFYDQLAVGDEVVAF